MEREVKAKKHVPEFCSSFAEMASQVASAGGKNLENMMRVIFDPAFDARKSRRYVKRFDDCEKVLIEKDEIELGKKDFGMRI